MQKHTLYKTIVICIVLAGLISVWLLSRYVEELRFQKYLEEQERQINPVTYGQALGLPLQQAIAFDNSTRFLNGYAKKHAASGTAYLSRIGTDQVQICELPRENYDLVTLCDGTESDAVTAAAWIEALPALAEDRLYWDLAFPTSGGVVHVITDSQTGKVVGYQLPES